MGRPLFLTLNRLYGANSYNCRQIGGADAENSAFPASNMADRKAGTLCKLTSMTGYFNAFLAAAVTSNCVAVLNHNFASDETIKLQGSTNSGNTWADITTLSIYPTSFFQTYATSPSYNAYRLELSAAGSRVALPYLGEFIVGTQTTLSVNYRWGRGKGKDFNTKEMDSEYAVPTVYFLNDRKAYKGDLREAMTTAQAAEVTALKDAVKGRSNPFLFAPDAAVPSTVIWGRLMEGSYDHQSIVVGRETNINLNVIEDPWGRPGA